MLLSTYPFLSIENIGKLTKRQYNALVYEAYNIAALKAGGKYEFETDQEFLERREKEFAERGGINWLRNNGR